MDIACCIPKPTNTHSEYVTLIDFPRHQWSDGLASISRLYVHCHSGWFRMSCLHFYMYGLYLVTFVITPSFCPSTIYIFKNHLLNWPFVSEAAVDSISVDKRQDTLIVFAGLVVLVHKPDLWRHKISQHFTICFDGGIWVAWSSSRNRRPQVLLHFIESAGRIRKNYGISLKAPKILKSHLSCLVPP
jgi:hypothetical protein